MDGSKDFAAPLDVPGSKRRAYLGNYDRITQGSGRLMLFAGDQKVEHLNDDFYGTLSSGEAITADDADPEQARRVTADMEEMKEKEVTLRETMLAAQRITEEMKSNSQKEATLLISEAELKADAILADANRKLADLNSQVQDLRREKMQFETALKSLLDTHYKMLSMNDE